MLRYFTSQQAHSRKPPSNVYSAGGDLTVSGVPRHQRVCQLCGSGFGDEMHLVFECAAMAIFQMFFRHIRQCSNSCGSQICCSLQVAKFLD